MSDRLRECPFCGDKTVMQSSPSGLAWWPRCIGCQIEGTPKPTEALAAVWWNTRPGETELVAMLKQLQNSLTQDGRVREPDDFGCCPVCGAGGHHDDCTLAALLAKHKGETR